MVCQARGLGAFIFIFPIYFDLLRRSSSGELADLSARCQSLPATPNRTSKLISKSQSIIYNISLCAPAAAGVCFALYKWLVAASGRQHILSGPGVWLPRKLWHCPQLWHRISTYCQSVCWFVWRGKGSN